MGLTAKEVESAKPAEKPYKLADARGLCLLVSPTGARLWRWRYRFDGKEKMMALGEYPDVTLKEARDRHSAISTSIAAVLGAASSSSSWSRPGTESSETIAA
jgi:hypothetical protein